MHTILRPKEHFNVVPPPASRGEESWHLDKVAKAFHFDTDHDAMDTYSHGISGRRDSGFRYGRSLKNSLIAVVTSATERCSLSRYTFADSNGPSF